MSSKWYKLAFCAVAAGLSLASASGADRDSRDSKDTQVSRDRDSKDRAQKPAATAETQPSPEAFPPDSTTQGAVTVVGGQSIPYRAVAGILTVGATDSYDASLGLDGRLLPDSGIKPPDKDKPEDAPATARMFYTAYFRTGGGPGAAPDPTRPVTFLYNGGPGSSTMWLHMGAFGPKRVVTTDAQHDTAAPYRIVENQYSLLDASDLVFIDAPGTGFSRILGKDKEKAFWGTDQDAHAFDRFIRRFLSKYNRWNSPKYLFGESYGTTRSAVVSNLLQNVDLNGVMLLSQILSFDNTADGPEANPGTDLGYITSLPSFAATAWYHHKIPGQTSGQTTDLPSVLRQAEEYALGEYASALLLGTDLPEARKRAVADKLTSFTGIPSDFWMRADLRVSGAQFARELQLPEGLTTGRLDSRYQGPPIRPLNSDTDYDPFTNAIGSAYTAAINTYVRQDLKFGEQMTYKPSAYSDPGFNWELRHRLPFDGSRPDSSVNVMHDLASTMKRNPKMRVMLMGGYFDLGTLYFGSEYEMKHLPIPHALESNISFHFFPTGHMVYINEDALRGMHDYAANFIRETQSGR